MWEKTHRPSQVYSTVFTLDDATLIVIDDLGKITWYAAATGAVRREIVRRRGSTASLMAGALSPDGATLAVGGSDHKVALYDIATGDLLHEITCSGWVWSLAFSPSGRMLAVGGDRHAQGPNLSLYDTGTNELLGEKHASRPWLFSTALSCLSISSRIATSWSVKGDLWFLNHWRH